MKNKYQIKVINKDDVSCQCGSFESIDEAKGFFYKFISFLLPEPISVQIWDAENMKVVVFLEVSE